MSRRLIAPLAGVLASVVFVVGCGGGDSSSADSPLTKAQLIKQGDAICKKGDKQIEAEVKEYAKENPIPKGKEPTAADQEKVTVEIVLPAIQVQAEEIGELAAPSGEEKKVEEIVEGVEAAVAKSEEKPSAILEGPGPFAKPNKLAAEYGFKVCGQGV